MKRTASSSSSILAVNSAITSLSGKAVIDISFRPVSSVPLSRSTYHLPLNRLPAAIDQRALVRPRYLYLLGRGPGCLLQRNPLLVRRHAIVLRPVERGERFELVERALLLEHFRIGFDRHRRVEHAGHTFDR